MQNRILILDFGSQYTQLIARRVRELQVYCEIHPYNDIPPLDNSIKGIILSGSPASLYDDAPPIPDLDAIIDRYPLLGVCFGAQFIAREFGGTVSQSKHREFGRANLNFVSPDSLLMKNIPLNSQVWMSHGDSVTKLPEGSFCSASTKDVQNAAFDIPEKQIWGTQFHPEVFHSTDGLTILKNFISTICGCSGNWTSDSFVETTVEALIKKLGNDKVVLGLSGGVDSSVAAMLLHKAIGKNLYCIFVDNGLLRKNEFEEVLASYQHLGFNVKGVDAKEAFYSSLAGKSEPEAKRKAIGGTFIDIFNQEAHKIKDVKWLGQGTIYPDVIESVSVKGPSATIKSHHNVGGLPEIMKLSIVEPLRSLFKDEVRRVGYAMGMRKELMQRHPFPGPGLGIRIIGEITPEKIHILQEVDAIFINGLKNNNLYHDVWQALAVLLPVQSVGVMGDERTYENVVALRAVGSTDGMTADWSRLPYEFLANVSNDIINKVKGVNRVVYDISSKPPATIEWE